jgi:hypothetical protein
MSSCAVRWPALAVVLFLSASACGSDSKPAAQPAGQAAPATQPATAGGASDAPAPAGAAPATRSAAPTGPQPSRAQADAMSVAELVQRRDLWPTKVAFLEKTMLDPTTWWGPGDELPLVNWDGANVYLDEGSFQFDCPAERTDVIERTRNVAASLSAEALALTVDALRARPELWPTRLTLTVSLQLQGNTMIPAGREVALRFFEGNSLSVYDREIANYYLVESNETNLMARARERLKLPEAERQPFFIRSIEAALDPAAGKAALADADFVLVYAGRLGCTRCAAFAPGLKEFYQRAQAGAPQGSRFELVYLPEDSTADAARKYLSEAGLPGGAIAFERRLEVANLMTLPLQTLPGLFVFDRAGNVVDRNHPDAGSPSAADVLAKFEARVKAGGGAAR